MCLEQCSNIGCTTNKGQHSRGRKGGATKPKERRSTSKRGYRVPGEEGKTTSTIGAEENYICTNGEDNNLMGVNGGSRGNSNSDSDLSEGNLMGYVLILEDRQMQEVYEYCI